MQQPTRKPDTVIGIDPDVQKSGVACLEPATRKLELTNLAFPQLLDFLGYIKEEAARLGKSVTVVIEAGWLNRSNWHLTARDSRALAAAKGLQAGRNHEVGRKIAEVCEHWQLPCQLVRPLQKTWRGKDGKITHEELALFTHITGRTNQHARDAALLAWTWAGLPVRVKAGTLKE